MFNYWIGGNYLFDATKLGCNRIIHRTLTDKRMGALPRYFNIFHNWEIIFLNINSL